MTLGGVSRQSAGMFIRFGPMAGIEFLAVYLGMRALHILLAPDDFRARMTGTSDATFFTIYLDPFVILTEVVFAVVFGVACLRIWWSMAPAPSDRWGVLTRNLVPLVVLTIGTGILSFYGLFIAFLPGLVIVALTSVLTPVILIEGAGWGGLRRCVALCAPQFWRLTLLWGAILTPWMLYIFNASGGAASLIGADMGALWLEQFRADVVSAALSAMILCVTMAAYSQLIDDEAGGGQNLMDIFR